MGEPFVPFDIDADYRRYVDGKPRYDGVAAFLAARSIEQPAGTPEDGPGLQTVHALGNLKDEYFMKHLQRHGADRYEDAIALVQALRAQDVRTAVVSSSNNCAAVLEAAGITQLFAARVDGRDISRLELQGKPAPDAFLEAARRVEVEVSRAVVVEDATAGVAAARAGRFGYVIGVDRGGQSRALREAGADVVATDLEQVQVAADPPSEWSLVYEGFDAAREGIRESLCALRNGYFTPRAAAWAHADGVHYPGTYLGGGYNRLPTEIAGRVVENEDLVNLPNWLALELRVADEDWFDPRAVETDSANRCKASKQADVLMLFYLFSADELGALFERLGYPREQDTILQNVAYYDQRSSHGSTLSRVVHAWVLARSDRVRSMSYFTDALQSDVSDIQQGTAAEGIHLGAMAGTVDLVQRALTGIEVSGDVLRLNPRLPEEVERLDMRIRYRGHSLDLRITRDTLTVRSRDRGAASIQLTVRGETCEFAGEGTRAFRLDGLTRCFGR
jgi:HAD superfamily hydrolase (TIGR01509 family)